jgi:NTE family protein
MDHMLKNRDRGHLRQAWPSGAKSTIPRRVLVLQGGGALGAYQAGVYEALAAEGLEPEWVTGISIGAINAALIAGNPPERRVERLRAFWELITSSIGDTLHAPAEGAARAFFSAASANLVAAFGTPGFFNPRLGGTFLARPGAPEALSLYDTAPLKKTLEELVDFDLLNTGATRLSIGAVDIVKGNTVVFDNAQQRIGPEHIMASGALPPGFPYVMIDGVAYWDGGLVSNTPLQFVLDEKPADPLVIFQIDLFSAAGAMPKTLMDADQRERDIRFSSRARMNTDTSLKLRKAKMVLRQLLNHLPPELAEGDDIALLGILARENAIRIVQLVYRAHPYEGRFKDYEFSRPTMLEHWASGLGHAQKTVRDYRSHIDTPADGIITLDPSRSTTEEEIAL